MSSSRLRAATGLALLPLLAACGTDGAGSADDADRVQVAAAFYPVAYLAERVGGDHVAVETLTEPGAEPHDLELTVRQTAAVAEADLVVYLAGFQPAVDEAVTQQASETAVDAPVARRGLDDEDEAVDDDHADDDHAEEGHDADHDHDGEDPHLWLDPLHMAATAEEYAARLAEVDPENAEDYRANAEAVVSEMEALDHAYEEGLGTCERSVVVVSHDAFGYLGRYGLDFEPIAGISPDAEPSPARLGALTDLVRDTGVTTIFTETLASPRLADTLADEVGVRTDVLDPIEGLTDDTAGEDYVSLMKSNLEALQQANGCS